MPKRRQKPEEIVVKLRLVDVLVSQGQSVADAIRSIGVMEESCYRWRREYAVHDPSTNRSVYGANLPGRDWVTSKHRKLA